MNPRTIANLLSKAQREMMINHVDHPLPVVQCQIENFTRKSLLVRKLIQPVEVRTSRPDATELTAFGREVVCLVLGDYADGLVRGGYIGERPNITLPHNLPMVAIAKNRSGEL